jgi:hypothetical protein
MADTEIQPLFASVCSRVVLNDEELIKNALQNLVNTGDKSSFSNKHVEIKDENIKESEVEFSSGELSTPSQGQWNYIEIDFYEDLDPDTIHFHSYFDIDRLSDISQFYDRIADLTDHIRINSLQTDLFVNLSVPEMGFYHEDDDVVLDGVKFTCESMDFSVYSGEHGCSIRGGISDNTLEIEPTKYEPFVNKKTEEIKTTIRDIVL